MDKTSTPKRQLSMCDMIPDDLSQINNQVIEKPCVTHNICADNPKTEKKFSSFLEWQKHNEDLLQRSVQGHHHSNV